MRIDASLTMLSVWPGFVVSDGGTPADTIHYPRSMRSDIINLSEELGTHEAGNLFSVWRCSPTLAARAPNAVRVLSELSLQIHLQVTFSKSLSVRRAG
jgi:hypothetical protein